MTKKYQDALQKLAEVPNVMLIASPLALFACVTVMQTGLRHPDFDDDPMADNVREFAKNIQKNLANISPLVDDILNAGWDEGMNDEMRAEVESEMLEDAEKWLKDFHQFLLHPSCDTTTVIVKVMEMKSAIEKIRNCNNLKGDARWESCQDLIRTIVAIIHERHNLVVAGMEIMLERINS